MADTFEEQLALPSAQTRPFEDRDKRSSRGLDHRPITSLAHGERLERAQSILITGPTGAGKT